MMGLIFYKHESPYNSELDLAGVDLVFIIYNPDNGETAFFNVIGDCDGMSDIEPFNEAQMAIVHRRWNEWLEDHPGMNEFDVAAHRDFMKGL